MDFNMMSNHLETLRWQFRLTERLAEFHLPALTDDACIWEPAPGSWTVRRSPDGKWRPDWVEPEPDPAPTVTIGWLTWHIIWWWSGLLAAVRNQVPVPRQEVFWPGNAEAVRRELTALSTEWTGVLSGFDPEELDRPFSHPWTDPRPISYAFAWCNSELMKNVAEIGYIRLLYESSRRNK